VDPVARAAGVDGYLGAAAEPGFDVTDEVADEVREVLRRCRRFPSGGLDELPSWDIITMRLYNHEVMICDGSTRHDVPSAG
jgi:hypothetical protein